MWNPHSMGWHHGWHWGQSHEMMDEMRRHYRDHWYGDAGSNIIGDFIESFAGQMGANVADKVTGDD